MDATTRVGQLVAEYGAADASAAWLLCDRHDPDAVAYRFVDAAGTLTEQTYGELAERSRRCAAALLARGIGVGDRVGTLMGKHADLPSVLLGIWRVGAVYVPLFTAFAGDTVRSRVVASRMRLLVTDQDNRAKCQELPTGCEVVEDATALFTVDPVSWDGIAVGGHGPFVQMFTSGTTGAPKAVLHSLAYAAGWQVYLEYGLGVGADDRFWCGADPGWAYGLYTGIVAPLAAGVPTMLVAGGFDPVRAWRILAEQRITDFAAAPTVYRALRRVPPSAPLVLNRLSSAGEPLTPEVNEWARRELGTTVHDHYGQTELGMIVGFHHHPELARPVRDNAMGTPLPGWRLSVLDSAVDEPTSSLGRLAVDTMASPLMTFHGYHEALDPRSRFTVDGRWYLTGDTASVDPDGVHHFSSRDDDVIIMAGYRIGPFDIESVLVTHPLVAECAVTAAPDEVRGEVIVAHVVLVDGASPGEELTAELRDLVRTRYAAHAYPRVVHYRPALPKTPSGKIKRAELRAVSAR
jgi:acetyl-CoA synthetase